MTKLDRRQFGTGVAALGALSLAAPALAAGRARIVIVGGGPGGATAAVELKRQNPALDVTLIERQKAYTSCFFSNHYIGGFRSFSSITHRYDGVAKLGVHVIHQTAGAIDTGKRFVRLEEGRRVHYDRLVVAPGIDFKTGGIEGYDSDAAELMPHAWKGGWQSRLLRRKLTAMPDGGVVVVAPPRNPYRCPPGPYERVCVIANYLKTAKPKSKVIVFDPKMAYSKQPVFEEAYAKYYKDIVEVNLTNDIDDMSVVRVNAKTGEVVTKSGTKVKAAVANIIPDQHAGNIAQLAGLVEGDWCPIHPENFRSTKADNVYVVGDAAIAQEMPKSAYSAHNQAKAVVADILADLAGSAHGPASYRNTCWSMLAPGDSVKIGANYAPGDLHGKHVLVPSESFVSQPGEPESLRKQEYEASIAWYTTLVSQLFAK